MCIWKISKNIVDIGEARVVADTQHDANQLICEHEVWSLVELMLISGEKCNWNSHYSSEEWENICEENEDPAIDNYTSEIVSYRPETILIN